MSSYLHLENLWTPEKLISRIYIVLARFETDAILTSSTLYMNDFLISFMLQTTTDGKKTFDKDPVLVSRVVSTNVLEKKVVAIMN